MRLASRAPDQWVNPVLALAVLAISSAAVLVRLAPDAHPVAVGFWRTLIVAVLLAPGLRRFSSREAVFTALAGICLAAHFWAWFASLHQTTVLRSTVLVCLGPIWAGLLEWGVWRLRPSRNFWLGISLALVGVWTIVAPASGSDTHTAYVGDGLALLGGLLAAIYLMLGRVARRTVSIAAYGSALSAVTAFWLLLIAFALDVPLVGFSAGTWWVFVGLALGPHLCGHIGFNFALRYRPASIVGAVTLLEPVGAAMLAAWLLQELPTGRDVLASGIVLVGVYLAMSQNSASSKESSPCSS